MCLLQSNCQIVSISIWKLTTKLITIGISDCFCRHITKLLSTADLKPVIQEVSISRLALCYSLYPQISYLFVLSTINNGSLWQFSRNNDIFFCNYYQTLWGHIPKKANWDVANVLKTMSLVLGMWLKVNYSRKIVIAMPTRVQYPSTLCLTWVIS